MILSDVEVVELAAWVAGPSAAGVMADWGADVVKVEPATGDPQRSVFGALGAGEQAFVPPFEVDNRGKRSVVLDLRSDAGRDAMDRLLARADVFITNMRIAALARLGLDHRTVRERHPRLIYGIITGYGLEGPDAHRPGYDIGAFWARSSLASSVVPPGTLPPGIRGGLGDHVTGMTLAGGICGALFDRERTGRATWCRRACCAPASTRRHGTWACCCASVVWKAPVSAPSRRPRSSTATPPPTAAASGCSGWRAIATGRA